MLIVVLPEGGAVQRVSAALDLEVNRRAASQTLLGVERIGDYIHHFDRLERRVDSGHMGKVRVVTRSSIYADVIGLIGRSIH